jgi:hypothetical protein
MRQYINVGGMQNMPQQLMGGLQPPFPQHQPMAIPQPTPSQWPAYQGHQPVMGRPQFPFPQQQRTAIPQPAPSRWSQHPAPSSQYTDALFMGMPQPSFPQHQCMATQQPTFSPYQQYHQTQQLMGRSQPDFLNSFAAPNSFSAGFVTNQPQYQMEMPALPQLGNSQESALTIDDESLPPAPVVEAPLPTPPATPELPKLKAPCFFKKRLAYIRRSIDSQCDPVAFRLFCTFTKQLSPTQQRKYCELAWPSDEAALENLHEMAASSPQIMDIYLMRLRGEAMRLTPQKGTTEEEVMKKSNDFLAYKEEMKASCKAKLRRMRDEEEVGQLQNRVGNVRGRKTGLKRKADEEAVRDLKKRLRKDDAVSLKAAKRRAKKARMERERQEEARDSSPAQEEVETSNDDEIDMDEFERLMQQGVIDDEDEQGEESASPAQDVGEDVEMVNADDLAHLDELTRYLQQGFENDESEQADPAASSQESDS